MVIQLQSLGPQSEPVYQNDDALSASNFPPPNILLFGIGWLGNGFARHIIGLHVAALELCAPLSITLVKKESTKPGSHCIVELEYLARDGLAPCRLVVE